jgi:hypothetical protein
VHPVSLCREMLSNILFKESSNLLVSQTKQTPWPESASELY